MLSDQVQDQIVRRELPQGVLVEVIPGTEFIGRIAVEAPAPDTTEFTVYQY